MNNYQTLFVKFASHSPTPSVSHPSEADVAVEGGNEADTTTPGEVNMSEFTLAQAVCLAVRVRERYEASNDAAHRPRWALSDYGTGFAGDVGDLVKILMAIDGKRGGEDLRSRLEHELSDCLWSVLVIADLSGVDMATTFRTQMARLSARLDA